MRPLRITVNGRAVPQGSLRMRVVRRRDGRFGAVAPQSREVVLWRVMVRAEALRARQAAGWPGPIDGPVAMVVRFDFARPKCHYGTGKNARHVRRTAPPCHAQRPDLDKLLRAVCDALTGVVFRDDAQVCRIVVEKRWGEEDQTVIEVHVVGDGDRGVAED